VQAGDHGGWLQEEKVQEFMELVFLGMVGIVVVVVEQDLVDQYQHRLLRGEMEHLLHILQEILHILLDMGGHMVEGLPQLYGDLVDIPPQEQEPPVQSS
jgi:hypothetical protein